jgi:SAM-dependent methyltransferase
MVENIPTELQYVVGTKWFEPGGSVLDVGCGDGKIAKWLVEQGFDVYAFDYAAPAVDRARAAYGGLERIEFAIHDVTAMPVPPRKFDSIFDRGCYHIIPERFSGRYVEGVASWAAPGAKFLLLGLVRKGPIRTEGTEDSLRRRASAQMRDRFSPYFDIEKVEYTRMRRGSGEQSVEPPEAVAVFMRRL